jgi:RNA polymerase sigma-70 factor (ECF subfamily)
VRREGADPESDAVLADSVAVALVVVRDRLTPAERIAFVLHDLFAWPFGEIGSILGRSESAAKQLASRARRRVRGSPMPSDASTVRRRRVVDAFLKAARAGDLEALLAVLDPDYHCFWQGSGGDVSRSTRVRPLVPGVLTAFKSSARTRAGASLAIRRPPFPLRDSHERTQKQSSEQDQSALLLRVIR